MIQPNDGVVRIRTFQPRDLEAIAVLMRTVFRPASIDARIHKLCGGTPWHKTKCQQARRQVEANPSGCFVAVDSRDGMVGFVSTAIVPTASRGCILDLAVARDFQGRGIGRRLIQRALKHFRKLGLAQAKIETLDDNLAGEHLYKQLGFTEVARQIHFAMPLTAPPAPKKKSDA